MTWSTVAGLMLQRGLKPGSNTGSGRGRMLRSTTAGGVLRARRDELGGRDVQTTTAGGRGCGARDGGQHGQYGRRLICLARFTEVAAYSQPGAPYQSGQDALGSRAGAAWL
ncbi:hypothetical protein GCM10010393_16210 [Streptomyces gobitricini]|uniref:Uncharacterized protein n=1 Tax=Streptomyces gobitricini TaxID=68211 RepID=A0ABP5YRW2_9ACTN